MRLEIGRAKFAHGLKAEEDKGLRTAHQRERWVICIYKLLQLGIMLWMEGVGISVEITSIAKD